MIGPLVDELVQDTYRLAREHGITLDEAGAIVRRTLAQELERVRNVTADEPASPERYALYRLCECPRCAGTGKTTVYVGGLEGDRMTAQRCSECRGEGRTRDLIATCATPEAIGVALVTLGREGEWEGCPIGILDTEGEKGEKWIVRPWTPSARNISDAGRVLRQAQTKEKT